MAYSTDSPSFRLFFTDGTFITLINDSANKPIYPPGVYTLSIPNLYVGDFDTDLSEVTKYDSQGNKYVFSNRGVVINDDEDLTQQASRMFFSYNPDTDTLKVHYCDPIPEFLPSINYRQWSYTGGVVYNSDTSGTSFSSFGELLANAQTEYETRGAWYRINNILERSPGIPFHGVTGFAGYTYTYAQYLENLLYNTHQAMRDFEIDIKADIEDYDPEPPPDPGEDPYNPDDGDETGPGGGDGDHDDSSDDIDIPPVPTLSAIDTGFITLYRPDASELRNLSNFLWSSPLALWDNLIKKLQKPMDCILGLSIVPVNPPVGTAKAIEIADISTGVNSYPVTSQYVEVDCGSITVNEYWGAYLDYEPYTKAEIYLPFIGTHPISIDDIMGKTITIKYHVDVLSGSCTAYVKCGRSVLYSFIGQCSSSIPINGNDWSSVINGALTIATAIGSMVATGGASAPMSANATPQQIAYAEKMHKAAMVRQAGNVASTAVNVLKPSIGKSGSMSGTGGLMAIQKPYLIITRPKQAIPGSQNHYMGYPSFITTLLGAISGYTEVEEVHLNGIPATDNEVAEIEELLKGGVYL